MNKPGGVVGENVINRNYIKVALTVLCIEDKIFEIFQKKKRNWISFKQYHSHVLNCTAMVYLLSSGTRN